jgi:hypothetical protein
MLHYTLGCYRECSGERAPRWTPDSYSRWTDRSVHLCSKTVRAIFMAHGSSVMRPLSSGIPPAVYNSWGLVI